MFLSRFRAQRKVSCTHRAWPAPMEMHAAGGWGPGTRSSASSTPPASSLCSLLQVDASLATACLLPWTKCYFRCVSDQDASRGGSGRDTNVSLSPGPLFCLTHRHIHSCLGHVCVMWDAWPCLVRFMFLPELWLQL